MEQDQSSSEGGDYKPEGGNEAGASAARPHRQFCRHHLCTVTPFSKLLAAALFILLPFLGAYVGYVYAPEKVVEVERFIETEVIDLSQDDRDELLTNIDAEPEARGRLGSVTGGEDVMTRMVIESPYQEMNGNYITDFHFNYLNSVYSLSFDFSRGIDFKPANITHPDAWSAGTFELWFERNSMSGPGRESYMGIIVLPKSNCSLARCELESKGAVAIGKYNWEILGSRKYCDAGECGGREFVYRYSHGDFDLYIESDTDLTNIPENETIYFTKILDTLTLEVL